MAALVKQMRAFGISWAEIHLFVEWYLRDGVRGPLVEWLQACFEHQQYLYDIGVRDDEGGDWQPVRYHECPTCGSEFVSRRELREHRLKNPTYQATDSHMSLGQWEIYSRGGDFDQGEE
jgi:hypothetical protein